jgi:hypothetical protein
MTAIRRTKRLYDAVAAGTGDWVALDYRYDDIAASRPLRIVLTAGDTLTLQGILMDEKGIDKSFLDTLLAEDISTLKIYTTSEVDVLDGTWSYIRAIKTGTAGKGILEGHI